MKRFVNNITVLGLDIAVDIEGSGVIESNSILDLQDSAFYDFEADVLEVCEMHDLELIESYESDVEGSNTQYYKYIKTNADKTKLLVYLKIRVSDHVLPTRMIHNESTTYENRDDLFLKNEAKEYAKEKFNQTKGYRPRRLNIIFNDKHFTTYEAALREVESKLDQIDRK